MGKFDKVKSKLAEAVSSENLIEDTETLAEYVKDPGNPVLIDPKRPVAIVRPQSLREVRKVVRILNEHRVSVVPRSCGLDYLGGTLPLVEDAVILDVSEMKKIVELCPNQNDGMYILVEPGATFEELQTELDKYDVRIPMPARHPAKATIVSTYANKNPSYRGSWQGLYSYPMLLPTIEVVTADGGVLESGGLFAGMPTISGVGMGLDRVPYGNLGTNGVMTKGAAIVELKPKVRKILFAKFDEYEDAAKTASRVLRYSSTEIGETHVLMNKFSLAHLLSESQERYDIAKRQLPPWTYALCISGPDEEWVEIQEKHLAEIAEEQRIEFVPEISGAKEAGAELLDEFVMPSRVARTYEYAPHNRVEFNTVFSRIPRYDKIIRDVASGKSFERPLGVFILPIEQGRTCYVDYDLYFDPSDKKEVGVMREMLKEIYPKLIDAGASFQRSDYPLINEKLREKAPGYYAFMDKFKEMLDPSNIFNPGRLFK